MKEGKLKVWMPVIRTGTGAEAYCDLLAEGLAGRGHDVVLDKFPHRFQYAPWLAGGRVPQGTDVAFANSWSAAAFDRGPPLVTVFHHVVHDAALAPHKTVAQALFHRTFVKTMERRALARSTRVVAISETTARAVTEAFGPARLDVVLNAVDTAFFSPGPDDRQGPSGTLRLLFVGKRSRRKGFDLVTEIVEAVGDRVALSVVGEGGECPAPKSARLLGKVDGAELPDLYRTHDFLLFPSRLEGFGLVAAEAMACGLPVLCLEGGAVEEVVRPPEGGIAVPPGDHRSLIPRAIRLREDVEAYAAMRRSARRLALGRYDMARWIDGMERVLIEAANATT